MFGNRVTDFPQHTSGLYGYTIIMDTTNLHLNMPYSIQPDANGVSGDPVAGETALNTLQEYINDEDCPDLAWNLSSDILTIFFKTEIYEYLSTTRFVLYGYRNNTPITSLQSSIDIKDRDLEWFMMLAIKKAALMQGKKVPEKIQLELTRLESIVSAGG